MPVAIEQFTIGGFCLCDLMTAMLLLGLVLLLLSLLIVHKLTKELPQGASRSRWYQLGVMILLFFVGYAGLLGLKYGQHYNTSEMLVAVILLFGSVFVLLVCLLSYKTTQELKRIYILEQETITDPLLGIFNRRYLDRRLQEEILRAQRHKLDLTVLMVDLDNFKRINDTWGHQIGDLVLQQLSRLMTDCLRQTDTVARFGGEEFVVMLPHTSEQESHRLAERLRRAVEQTPLHKMPELYATVSIGITRLLPDNDSIESLLGRADKAMYQAKHEGRNRVVCYPRCDFSQSIR